MAQKKHLQYFYLMVFPHQKRGQTLQLPMGTCFPAAASFPGTPTGGGPNRVEQATHGGSKDGEVEQHITRSLDLPLKI